MPVEVGIRGTDRVEVKGALVKATSSSPRRFAGLEDGDNVRPVRADQVSR